MTHPVHRHKVMRRGARNGIAAVFFVLAQVCGALMWFTYISIWMHWQDGFGFIIGVMTAPGIVIFPIMFYIAENRFPVGYCVLWLMTALLWVASMFSFSRD